MSSNTRPHQASELPVMGRFNKFSECWLCCHAWCEKKIKHASSVWWTIWKRVRMLIHVLINCGFHRSGFANDPETSKSQMGMSSWGNYLRKNIWGEDCLTRPPGATGKGDLTRLSGGGNSLCSKDTVGFLKFMFLNVLPDPGALYSCMHTFPKKNHEFTMVWHIILCIWIWDLRPSIWKIANSN